MIIETREFGYVEINENDIIHFPNGIYGFEDIKEYVILQRNEDKDCPIMWMQAINDIHIRFVVFNPLFVVDKYEPEITDDILKMLNVSCKDMLRFYVIAVVPKDIKDITVNLKSPIVVNSENNQAVQVILENSEYAVRHFLFNGNEVANKCL